ncbi:restriction endonuclease subunit S [Candidatus Palauibacter sp.]|uniref:restriction endonuclease subunit S n=1 Tax=Candidatus Palauibacter sp. TaxID=3101350 RepID=UPI003B013BB3
MIAAMKSYPAMEDSGVEWLGEVPEHWEVRRLGTSVHGCINGTWGGEPDGKDDLPCVRVADFDRLRLRIDLREPTIRAVPIAERKGRILNGGDLLLEKSGGGDLQLVGAVMLYDHEVPAVCSNFIGRMPVSPGHNPQYLSYLHSHLYTIRLNARSIKQTTGIQNLDSTSYLGERVAFAPLSEQVAIVRFLDHADRRIRRYIRAKERLIELLEEQKQAIIHQAVTGRIDVRTGQPYPAYKDSGVEWLGEVPEHWEVRRLNRCVRAAGGMTPSMQNPSYWMAGSIPWVTPKDMKVDAIGDSEMKVTEAALDGTSLRLVDSGTVLLVVRGMILAKCVPVAWTTSSVTINQDMKALLPVPGVDGEFLARALRSGQAALLSFVEVAGHGTRRLPTEQWRSLRVAIPSPNEQERIVAFVAKSTQLADSAIEAATRLIELLREYRTCLVADVVTGKLDVRDAAASLPDVDPLGPWVTHGEPEANTAVDAEAPDPALQSSHS